MALLALGQAVRRLQRRRVGLRGLAGLPGGGSLQRLDSAGFVEVDHRVELARERGVEVVARALGLGR